MGHNSLESEIKLKRVELLLSEGIKKIIDISAGGWHSCALTGNYKIFYIKYMYKRNIEDGDVYGWGWNQYGQLGNDEVNF